MNDLALYNEIDDFAADWLENLVRAGHIAPGVVDRRSIVDLTPGDLLRYRQVHFFAGIGGWSYALRLAGWPDDRPVWTGSCPCQPFSLAGKRKGFDDERHLWPVWRELIRECNPPIVFGEQVASASDWLRLVRGDLEAMGHAVGAIPFEAASAGADHLRDRYGFVAYANNARSQGRSAELQCADQWTAGPDGLADTPSERRGWRAPNSERPAGWHGPEVDCRDLADGLADASCGRLRGSSQGQVQQPGRAETERPGDFDWVIGADGKARRVKPGICLLAHGVPNRVGLLRGFGNAINPRAFAQFILAAQEAIGDVKR